MTRCKNGKRWATVGALILGAALLTGMVTPMPAAACDGCVNVSCAHGLKEGVYGCSEGEGSCGLVYRLFFGCDARWCEANGEPCPPIIDRNGPPDLDPNTRSADPGTAPGCGSEDRPNGLGNTLDAASTSL